MGKVFIFGILRNISLDSFTLDKRYGVVWKDQSSIREILKQTKGMVKEHAGIKVDKFTLESGRMEKETEREH